MKSEAPCWWEDPSGSWRPPPSFIRCISYSYSSGPCFIVAAICWVRDHTYTHDVIHCLTFAAALPLSDRTWRPAQMFPHLPAAAEKALKMETNQPNVRWMKVSLDSTWHHSPMNRTIFRSTTQIGRRETCKSNSKRKGNNHLLLAKLRSLLGSDIRVVTLNSNGPTSRWRWWTRRRHKRQEKQKGKTSDLVFFALFQRISRKFGISFGDRKVSFVQLVDFDSFDQLNRRELGSQCYLN